MKRPDPRLNFKDPVEQYDHIVDCVCWMTAATYPCEGSQGQIADHLRRLVDAGQLIIDIHPDGDKVRLIPSIQNGAAGTA